MDGIERLREEVVGEEFDYQALLSALRSYRVPRDAISRALTREDIVRVKKGIYIFGLRWRRRPPSREILANLIHGPSYVSFDSALYHHGLIPEQPSAVTSATSGRPTRFSTPLGLFVYRTVPLPAYSTGVDRVRLEDGTGFLLAEPEKALADKLHDDRGTGIRTQATMRVYLLESLRLEEESLMAMDVGRLEELGEQYRSAKIRTAAAIIRALRCRGGAPGGRVRQRSARSRSMVSGFFLGHRSADPVRVRPGWGNHATRGE